MNKKTALVVLLLITGCAGKIMKSDHSAELKPSEEFEKSVKIVVPESPPEESSEDEVPSTQIPEKAITTPIPAEPAAKTKKAKKVVPPKSTKSTAATKADPYGGLVTLNGDPDVEDQTGRIGRRPAVDPFRVGESVVHDLHWMKISAGTLTLRVDPFAEVDGRKAYNFVTAIRSNPTFSSMVYAADDKVVTLVDFELLIPRVFTLHVKESKQLREARSLFDFKKNEAKYWEKKITDKNGVEEKRQQWAISPWSQNVFSAVFYMRLFPWEPGKEFAFRVADDEDNLVFKGKALRRETLKTKVGSFKTIVVKPEITTKGVFKPMGEILIWLSDDDRKLVLRIESEIKIGTIVSEVVKLNRGRD